MVLKSERGQTMVEYMLLLAVAVSLVVTFYNSEAFKRIFGSKGQLGKMIKSDYEFGYRHAYIRNKPASDVSRDIIDGSEHPSYHSANENGTHFFGAKDPYP